MIDGVSRLRIEIPQRIVGESCQMKNRVDAVEISNIGVPHVLADGGYRLDFSSCGVCAASEEITIIANNAMTSSQHHRCQHRADITEMPRHHDTHWHYLSPTSLPRSRSQPAIRKRP